MQLPPARPGRAPSMAVPVLVTVSALCSLAVCLFAALARTPAGYFAVEVAAMLVAAAVAVGMWVAHVRALVAFELRRSSAAPVAAGPPVS